MGMRCVKYIFYFSINKPLAKILVALFQTEAKSEYSGLQILGQKNKNFDEFSSCVCDALRLLEKERPVEYRTVKKNLRHIIYRPGLTNYLAKYFNLCCLIPWDRWKIYNKSIRYQIMAAAITHEAYHGEYLTRFGCRAFGNVQCEMKCREREIRVLRYFQDKASNDDAKVFDRRISSLRAEGKGGDPIK